MKIAYKGFIYESYSKENISLLKYMKDPNLDPYNADVAFAFKNWLEEEGDDSKIAEFEDGFFDAYEFSKKYPELLAEFTRQVNAGTNQHWHDAMAHSGHSRAHMAIRNNNLLPRSTWLIHFSRLASEIALDGFKYGASDQSDLGLTTHKGNAERFSEPGYNFAYISTNLGRNYEAYGDGAVMFQNAGVHVYHYGDDENQVIFFGPDVKEVV
jgi:hypothetical protein